MKTFNIFVFVIFCLIIIGGSILIKTTPDKKDNIEFSDLFYPEVHYIVISYGNNFQVVNYSLDSAKMSHMTITQLNFK